MQSLTLVPAPAAPQPQPAVVVCIAGAPEERSRLARLYDGVGVLVMAADPDSASSFLDRFAARGDAHVPGADVVRVGGLELDLAGHEASWEGRPLALTRHELGVLGCLARRPGRAWTYQQLYDKAWDGAYFTGPTPVQAVVKRLRNKIREAGLPLRIRAARGLGFRLDPERAGAA